MDAVAAEQTAVERAAIRLAAILVLGVYGALGLLASGAPAFGWLGRMPWWLPPAGITVLAAVIVAAMPIFLLRRDIADAWIALTYLSRHGHDAWHRRYGEPLPDSASTDAWLASHPGIEHPIVRAQVLAISGRADEARAALPAEDELSDLFSRFLRAQVGWLAAFLLEDRAASERERRRMHDLVSEHDAGEDRAVARAVANMADAFESHAEDEDWVAPLAAARRALGPLARWTALRWLVVPRLAYYGRISLIIFAAIVVLELGRDAFSS